MDFIEKLHRRGLTLSQMLSFVDDDRAEITNSKKLSDLIKKCSENIEHETGLFYESGGAPENSALLNDILEPYQETITDLEKTLLKSLSLYGQKGFFVAFGYNSIDNPYPVAIPIHEWIFLKVDVDNNTAYCEDRKYKDVKFVLSTELKRLPTNELNQLNLLVNKKSELENNIKAEQEPNKEQTKESEIKLENVQEQSKNKQPNPRKSRKDNLTKAILAACESFDKKPSFDELWRFFQEDKDKTGFIVDFTDTHLIWHGTKGKMHDTQKESVANRLSRINYP